MLTLFVLKTCLKCPPWPCPWQPDPIDKRTSLRWQNVGLVGDQEWEMWLCEMWRWPQQCCLLIGVHSSQPPHNAMHTGLHSRKNSIPNHNPALTPKGGSLQPIMLQPANHYVASMQVGTGNYCQCKRLPKYSKNVTSTFLESLSNHIFLMTRMCTKTAYSKYYNLIISVGTM